MKIIISPSKTQDFTNILNREFSKPKYMDKSLFLVKQICSLPKDDIKKIMKINDALLDESINNYQNFNTLNINHSISSYIGLVFKQLDIKSYNEHELTYLNDKVRILSALYGILKPFDGIKAYRLDLKMKLTINLYDYWECINNEFEDELIINLASDEFSKLIKKPMINISFLERKDGEYKNMSTYSKQARGLMIHYLITNQIDNLEEFKLFNLCNYQYNEQLSTSNHLIFTRG